jgi:hypothetical protein
MKYLPYIVLEVILPGGTLFAAGLWAYRNRKNIAQAVSNRLPAIRLTGISENI